MHASQEQNQRNLHRSSLQHRQTPPNTHGDAGIPSATSHLPPQYGDAGIPPATYNHPHQTSDGYHYSTHHHGYINPHQMGDANNYTATHHRDVLYQSEMQMLQDRLLKKQNKALTNWVTSPLGVALRNLTQVNFTASYAMEKAIRLRAKKPKNETLNAIFKDPGKILWDHPLALAAITAAFETEIDRLKNSSTPMGLQQASKVKQNLSELLIKLAKDQLRIPPNALMSTFSSMFQREGAFLHIIPMYEEVKKTLIADADNKIDHIYRTEGICWRHVSGAYCNPKSCPFDHRCLICWGTCRTAQCSYNHARWNIAPKSSTQNNSYKKNKNYNYSKRRNNRNNNNDYNPPQQTSTIAQGGGNMTGFNGAPSNNKR